MSTVKCSLKERRVALGGRVGVSLGRWPWGTGSATLMAGKCVGGSLPRAEPGASSQVLVRHDC
jgi:hypothetical protein